MTPRRFYSIPTPGVAGRTYYVLGADGRTVVEKLASCPDGIEVPRPADVRFSLAPWSPSPGDRSQNAKKRTATYGPDSPPFGRARGRDRFNEKV